MTIHLVVIITGLGVGGAEHALLKILSRVDANRVKTSVVVLGTLADLAPQFREVGIEPVFVGMGAGRWPLVSFLRLISVARSLRPDVIQGWMYHGNLAASVVGAWLKVPVCWSVRDTPDPAHGHSRFTRATIRISSLFVGKVARIFNVSTRSSAYCCEHFGWPAERTEILPNGLDLGRFRPDAVQRSAVRAELGLPLDTPLIAMVARWSKVKNHRLFLEAAAIVTHSRPEVRFALVGTGLDALNAELAAWIDEFKLSEAVLLLGPRHDVNRLYPAFDVLALTSHSEGFPNVVAEAMACGVPVVSTDVGDACEIVGDCGYIVSPDADAVAAAMMKLIDCSDASLGGRARQRIEARYGIDKIVDRLLESYDRLLSERSL